MHWKAAGTVVFLTLCLGVAAIWGQTGDVEEAKRLDQEVIQLYQQGKYAEAARLGERALGSSIQ